MKSPEDFHIGMDFSAKQAEFSPYIEGEPILGINSALGGEGSVSGNINFNSAFLPGAMRVKIGFKFNPDPQSGLEPEIRVRLHYWPKDLWVSPFETTSFGYAIDVIFRLEKNNEGEETVELVEDVQGMPDMRVTDMRPITDPWRPTEWNEYEILLQMHFALSEREWMTGVQLSPDDDTRRAVENGFRQLHSALAIGPEATFSFYKPLMINQGAGYGYSAREWFDANFGAFFSPEAELMPIEFFETELVILGHGRLATLYPSPVAFSFSEEGSVARPLVYFWKDEDGNWHPKD